MALRWSRVSPQLALIPAVAVTLVAFVGAIGWTIYMSFTALPALPRLRHRSRRMGAPVRAPVRRRRMGDLAPEHRHPRRSAARSPSCFGFVLAAMIEREKRGEGFFRTIFLYPLAVSLIVTGIVWRWMFNPTLGIQNFLHQLGWESAELQLARRSGDRDVRHHPRLDLARARLLHGADAGRPEIDQHRDLERGASSTA